jgi:hypothetical protein
VAAAARAKRWANALHCPLSERPPAALLDL